MKMPSYRIQLEQLLTAYAETLGDSTWSGWDQSVRRCPGWTVRDLTHHLIDLHLWVTDAIAGRRGTEPTAPATADDRLAAGFADSAAILFTALDADPDTPCWTFGDDHTVGFWQRRQVFEHAIHLWDLYDALGILVRPLDAELAADGIAEVVDFFWPRQIALGRAEEPSNVVEVRSTNPRRSWLVGSLAHPSPTPVAHLSGTAPDLFLTLWKRLPLDDPRLVWTGDREAGASLLGRKIVP
jgi:uncharacterized protein (TIGR03083 family)